MAFRWWDVAGGAELQVVSECPLDSRLVFRIMGNKILLEPGIQNPDRILFMWIFLEYNTIPRC